MAGGHTHALYLHGDTALHRCAPQVKITAAFGLVLAIVATPREAVWAFVAYAALIIAAGTTAGLTPGFAGRRLLVEIPFLFVALFLPLLGGGDTVTVAGIDLSVAGLWDAWNILAKATLGLGVAIVLGATTQVTQLLSGLDGLRVPAVVTAIAGFMVRYIDVIADDWSSMRVAMASRGHDPRWFTQLGPYARMLGAIFVRTYERGERVYLAMAARGYAGSMPASLQPPTPLLQWVSVATLLTLTWSVTATAWITR